MLDVKILTFLDDMRERGETMLSEEVAWSVRQKIKLKFGLTTSEANLVLNYWKKDKYFEKPKFEDERDPEIEDGNNHICLV